MNDGASGRRFSFDRWCLDATSDFSLSDFAEFDESAYFALDCGSQPLVVPRQEVATLSALTTTAFTVFRSHFPSRDPSNVTLLLHRIN